jgi:hypothetical protein
LGIDIDADRQQFSGSIVATKSYRTILTVFIRRMKELAAFAAKQMTPLSDCPPPGTHQIQRWLIQPRC